MNCKNAGKQLYAVDQALDLHPPLLLSLVSGPSDALDGAFPLRWDDQLGVRIRGNR